MPSKFRQPTAQQLEGFVKGDRDLIEEVIHLLLPQLQRWALKTYFSLPQDDVKSVVNRVLAETCLHHSRYDPLKSRLTTYIIRLISKRMVDLYESTKRTAEHEELFSDPPPELEYSLLDIAEIDTRIVRTRFFEGVKKRLDKAEGDVLELMRQGEDSRKQFLLVLQRHQSLDFGSRFCVKNFKARVMKKVRAIASKQGYDKHALLDVPAHRLRNPYL